MATNLGELKRKRRQPDVRTIKKHSDIMRRRGSRATVGGTREKTNTGYEVRGFQGKTFETYFETMLAGTSTATLRHEKKDRTIRILSGVLYVLTEISEDGKGLQNQTKAIPGDEVVFERGTAYRLATSKEDVEFFVCQSAKYAATLEIVDGSSLTSREIDPRLLAEPLAHQRLGGNEGRTLRRGSKAKQQLAAQRAGRGGPAITEPIPGREGTVAPPPDAATASYGTNPQPTGGKFSD